MILKNYACERNNRLERKSYINVDLREDLQGLFDVVRDTLDLMPLPLTLAFFLLQSQYHYHYYYYYSLHYYCYCYFLFPSYFALFYLTAWSRLIYSSLCTWLFFRVFCILGWGWGGFVLGQFSFRAPESLTLRTTNGKK